MNFRIVCDLEKSEVKFEKKSNMSIGRGINSSNCDIFLKLSDTIRLFSPKHAVS